jgi:hypothetical protein
MDFKHTGCLNIFFIHDRAIKLRALRSRGYLAGSTNHNIMHFCNTSSTLRFYRDQKRCIALSPKELQLWLASHKDEIAELALTQPLFAARPDDIGYGLDLLAGFLKRNWISYDKDDPDCQQYIKRAAWDYVLCPIANRVL